MKSFGCNFSEKKMTNPRRHIMIDEEAARAAEECYAVLEAKLQALHLCNEELTRGL